MLAQWQRRRAVRSLKDPAYRQLFEETPDEVVSLACETTSLDVKEAELLAIAAVRVQRNRIVASQSLYLLVKPARQPTPSAVGAHGLRPRDVAAGLDPDEAMRRLLDFIGGRPLAGYYLDFAVAVLDKYARPLLGIGLPNRKIEISARYYDYKLRQHPGSQVDLRLAALIDDLGIPALPRRDALDQALNTAMLYLALKRRGFG